MKNADLTARLTLVRPQRKVFSMNMTQDEHTRYAAIAKRLQLPLSDIIKNLLDNLDGQLGEPLETK